MHIGRNEIFNHPLYNSNLSVFAFKKTVCFTAEFDNDGESKTALINDLKLWRRIFLIME